MNELLKIFLSDGGAVLFIVVLLEQAGLPIPAAPLLLAAGALSATGETTPGPALLVTVVACLMADVAWYNAGRSGGKRVLQLLSRFAWSSSDGMEQMERNFGRYGMPMVTLSKFIPGAGVLVAPVAGALGIRFSRFVVFDVLGAVAYGAVYLSLGSIFSNQVHALLQIAHRLGLGTLILIVAGVGCYAALKLRTGKKPAPMGGNKAQPQTI